MVGNLSGPTSSRPNAASILTNRSFLGRNPAYGKSRLPDDFIEYFGDFPPHSRPDPRAIRKPRNAVLSTRLQLTPDLVGCRRRSVAAAAAVVGFAVYLYVELKIVLE